VAEKDTRDSYTYQDAGVDIDAGNELVDSIKPAVADTGREGVMGSLGGFGGLFDIAAAGYTDPILVAATDGVGTKLKIAFELNKHDTIGIDLVAMCVNDLIVQGAEPLFFLDYFATGKLSKDVAREVIVGIAAGCKQAGCALIGGETAEMPGMYPGGEYDVAGFAVGAAERDRLLPSPVEEGDVILGLGSSGIHSNGFSLVRKLIDDSHLDLHQPAPFDETRTLGESLLEPTRIYAKQVIGGIRAGKVSALAHITGGGITENVPRILPNGLDAQIDLSAWDLPPVFAWLKDLGDIDMHEMLRTFNCGIGLVLVAPKKNVALLKKSFEDSGEPVFEIGHISQSADSGAEATTQYSGQLSPASD